jgi:DNA-binding transcriptional ArsR family regulator
MPAIADQLRQYAEAIADSTRGTILVELDRAGELTATQLARRLGLTANNVYHHMRVLLQLGVVDPPRVVPGDTYVEKYYHVNLELRAALRLDPGWYDPAHETLTLEDRQSSVVSFCLTMSHLLRRAAQEYQEMDPETLDRHAREQQLMMFSISRISREELKARLQTIQLALFDGDSEWAEDLKPRTDLLLIAGLPSLRDEGTGQSE